MNALTLEEKLNQYTEFFAIEHKFSVNVKALEQSEVTSFEAFNDSIPLPFKLATEVNAIDQSALRSLQNLGSAAGQLVSFLNQQSQKIDLLIGYILSQQDDEKNRHTGVEFGGGGIKLKHNEAFNLGQLLELKIFLIDSHCAIYCYGEVIEIKPSDNGFIHKITFIFIREEDRESLVRASLHEQSKQLQMLAKLRNQESEL